MLVVAVLALIAGLRLGLGRSRRGRLDGRRAARRRHPATSSAATPTTCGSSLPANRVVVGDKAPGEVTVAQPDCAGGCPACASRCPVGHGLAEFAAPSLARGGRALRCVPRADHAARHRADRPRADRARRPGRPAAARGGLGRVPRPVRPSAHHRHPEHEHRLRPRPRGRADARPHRERHRVPCAPRVRARRRAPQHPLEVDGEDRQLHGAPVRGDPAQPPAGRAQPVGGRLRHARRSSSWR